VTALAGDATADVHADAVELVEVTDAVEESPMDLAEALRRAASQMESEGVIPAPAVEDLAALSSIGDGVADAASVEVEAPDVEPSVAGDATAWPWEATEGAPAQTPAAGSESVEPTGLLPSFTSVGIDDAGLDDITLLTRSSAAEPFEARPMIVGEYPDRADDVHDAGSAIPVIPDTDIVASDGDGPASEPTVEDGAGAVEEPDVVAAALEPAAPEGDPAAESAYGDIAAAAAAVYESAEASSEAEVRAYEPGGLEIAGYTCDDCVYVDTCPKARQDGPATCGSFQWKSV
jgi:hypothetical protein